MLKGVIDAHCCVRDVLAMDQNVLQYGLWQAINSYLPTNMAQSLTIIESSDILSKQTVRDKGQCGMHMRIKCSYAKCSICRVCMCLSTYTYMYTYMYTKWASSLIHRPSYALPARKDLGNCAHPACHHGLYNTFNDYAMSHTIIEYFQHAYFTIVQVSN